MDPFWIIVLVMVGIAIAVSVSRGVYERKRTQAWKELARTPGMRFLGDRNDVLTRCAGLRLFSVGRSRKMYNAIEVQAGDIQVVTGDFRYVTGSGKNSTTHRQTICVLENAAMNVPHCTLRPERKLLDTIGAWFGGKDLDFAEDSAFSGAYVLQGDDETAVRALFDAQLRAWFAERKRYGIHFEARGHLLVFHRGNRCPPQEAPELMDQALQLMRRLAAPG